MVKPQAIMFEPTADVLPSSVSPTLAATASCDVAAAGAGGGGSGGDDAASETDGAGSSGKSDGDQLQRHRMIVPLDIVTSITISQNLSIRIADARYLLVEIINLCF